MNPNEEKYPPPLCLEACVGGVSVLPYPVEWAVVYLTTPLPVRIHGRCMIIFILQPKNSKYPPLVLWSSEGGGRGFLSRRARQVGVYILGSGGL